MPLPSSFALRRTTSHAACRRGQPPDHAGRGRGRLAKGGRGVASRVQPAGRWGLGYSPAQDLAFVRLEPHYWPWQTQDLFGRLRLGLVGQAAVAVSNASEVVDGRKDAADTSRLLWEQDLAGQLEVRPAENTRFRVGVSYPLVQTQGRYLRHNGQFEVQRLQRRDGLGGSAEVELRHPSEDANLRCAVGVSLRRMQVQQRHFLGWRDADGLQSEVYLRTSAGPLALRVGYEPDGKELRCSVGLGV